MTTSQIIEVETSGIKALHHLLLLLHQLPKELGRTLFGTHTISRRWCNKPQLSRLSISAILPRLAPPLLLLGQGSSVSQSRLCGSRLQFTQLALSRSRQLTGQLSS